MLLFLCCHPAITPPAQVALTLRAVGGLSTAEIARSLLLPEATITRRITRAKQSILAAGGRFALPDPADRAAPARRGAARRLPDLHRGPHRHRR